jgi:hypothetical protein
MLKGLDPIYAPLYGVRHVPQGVVHGKRSGFSRCLGPLTLARRVSETYCLHQDAPLAWFLLGRMTTEQLHSGAGSGAGRSSAAV